MWFRITTEPGVVARFTPTSKACGSTIWMSPAATSRRKFCTPLSALMPPDSMQRLSATGLVRK